MRHYDILREATKHLWPFADSAINSTPDMIMALFFISGVTMLQRRMLVDTIKKHILNEAPLAYDLQLQLQKATFLLLLAEMLEQREEDDIIT